MKQQNGSHNSVSNAFIYIISDNILQNELLLSFLKDKIGLLGSCLSRLAPETIKTVDGSAAHKFVLIDCKSIDLENIWFNLPMIKKSDTYKVFFALFNVDTKKKIEKKAMGNGIHGIFYDSDPLDSIPEGINAILKGGLWYSEETLTQILPKVDVMGENVKDFQRENLLTSREKEILLLISLGHNSRIISDKLRISGHTVKTHIYNIYGKINVNNRLQATLWAAKYL